MLSKIFKKPILVKMEDGGLALRTGKGQYIEVEKPASQHGGTAVQVVDSLTSNSTSAALSANQGRALKAAVDAKADLVNGKVPASQIPDIAIVQYLGTAANQAAMLALVGQQGDWCIRSDDGRVYVLVANNPALLASWQVLSYPVIGASTASQAIGNVSGAAAINLSSGPNVALTVTGATTLSFTGLPANNTAQRVVLTITNGGAGAITWPTGTRWMGAGIVGSAPTLVALGTEKIAIDITNNGGTITYDAAYLGRVA